MLDDKMRALLGDQAADGCGQFSGTDWKWSAEPEHPRTDFERGEDGDAGGDGMKIEIDIDEYFTPEMIKKIAEDELRGSFRQQFQKESDVECVIANLSSEFVFTLVKEQWDGDFTELLRKKIRDAIEDDTLKYIVFRRKDAWGRTESPAVAILDEELKNSRPLIRECVEKHIREYPFHELEKDEIGEVIYNVIMNRILSPQKEVVMTQEEAIKALRLEGGIEINGNAVRVAEFLQGLDVALTALRPVSREQVEKVWKGCRSCKSCRSCVYNIHDLKDMPCKKCDPNAEGIVTEYKPSNFCPVCGKPLTDEAVEMVMERMEALE